MPDVVFAVPYALDTSLRFVRACAALPGVRLGVVSQEPRERLPDGLLERLAGFEQVEDALDADQLAEGVRAVARHMDGNVDRLIGVLEQLQVPMATVRQRFGIRGMGVDEAHNFRDKARMKDVLREHGLPCARHRLCTSAAEALDGARAIGLPLVAKPPAGAGARNTVRVDALEDLESYLRSVPPTPEEPLLLEEFITGREHSFDSVSVGGRHVFHSISRYHPSPLEVMRHAWLQWCVVLPRDIEGLEYADIHAAGRRALDCLGMHTGLTHMEWFRRQDGSLAISEVGARPPGAQFTTLLSYAHDTDFYRAWAELMAFERFDVPERRFAAGAVFLRGQGSGKVRAVEGLDRARRELGDMIVEARLPRVDQPPASSYEGQGFVIVRHPETEAVEHGLDRLMDLIKVELG